MIKLISAIVLVFHFINQLAYAKTQNIDGSANLENTTLENFTINGTLNFKDLVIQEELHVSGWLEGKNLNAKKIEIDGSFEGENIKSENLIISGSFSGVGVKVKDILKVDGSLSGSNIVVQGATKVAGVMSVSGSEFVSIELETEKSDLTASKAKTILVKEDKTKVQKLELRKKTIISDDVTFESGKGEVYLYDGSEILGKVRGAVVIKK